MRLRCVRNRSSRHTSTRLGRGTRGFGCLGRTPRALPGRGGSEMSRPPAGRLGTTVPMVQAEWRLKKIIFFFIYI